MWYKYLDRILFIEKLYSNIPEITDVRINTINIGSEGDRISVVFDMPYFADNPPQKWIRAKYNTVCVQLDFFDIKSIILEARDISYIGNISIGKDNENLSVIINGSVKARIIAGVGIIQSITAY